MNTFAIGYAIVATLFFLMIAKYDIHMFQLSSYRNSRYFRWLVPGNIISLKRILAFIMFLSALIPGYWGIGIATVTAIAGWVHCLGEKFKTPLVYTMRVRRLFLTDILLFVAIVATALVSGAAWSMTSVGTAILLSNKIGRAHV